MSENAAQVAYDEVAWCEQCGRKVWALGPLRAGSLDGVVDVFECWYACACGCEMSLCLSCLRSHTSMSRRVTKCVVTVFGFNGDVADLVASLYKAAKSEAVDATVAVLAKED